MNEAFFKNLYNLLLSNDIKNYKLFLTIINMNNEIKSNFFKKLFKLYHYKSNKRINFNNISDITINYDITIYDCLNNAPEPTHCGRYYCPYFISIKINDIWYKQILDIKDI